MSFLNEPVAVPAGSLAASPSDALASGTEDQPGSRAQLVDRSEIARSSQLRHDAVIQLAVERDIWGAAKQFKSSQFSFLDPHQVRVRRLRIATTIKAKKTRVFMTTPTVMIRSHSYS
jgi:hypothetical protein